MTQREFKKIILFPIALLFLTLFFAYEIYKEKSFIKAVKKHPSIVAIMMGGALMIIAILRAK